MANDYNEDAQDALELLEDFGRVETITLKRSVGGTIDIVEGTKTGATEETSDVTGVVLPPKSGIKTFGQEFVEELIRGDGRFVIIDAINPDFEPQVGNRLEWDSEEWEIKRVSTISPAGTPVIHKMGVVKK